MAIHAFILENVRYDKLKKPYSHEIIGPPDPGGGGVRGHRQNGEGPVQCGAGALHRGSQRGGPGAGREIPPHLEHDNGGRASVTTWTPPLTTPSSGERPGTTISTWTTGTSFGITRRWCFRCRPARRTRGTTTGSPVLHQAGGRGEPRPPGPAEKAAPFCVPLAGRRAEPGNPDGPSEPLRRRSRRARQMRQLLREHRPGGGAAGLHRRPGPERPCWSSSRTRETNCKQRQSFRKQLHRTGKQKTTPLMQAYKPA